VDPAPTPLHFYALSAGLGNVVILTLGNKALLLDAGTQDFKDMSFFPAALAILSDKKICAIVITHPHCDHLNAIWRLLSKLHVPAHEVSFVCGGFRSQIIDQFLRTAIPDNAIFTIDEGQVGEGPDVFYEQDPTELAARIESVLRGRLPELHFEVFLPKFLKQTPLDRANVHVTCNLIVKIGFRGRSILVTGDAQHETVSALGIDRPFGNVDLYLVPHHGSKHPNKDGTLGEVVPKIAVCCVDATCAHARQWGHPNGSAVQMFAMVMPLKAMRHRIAFWQEMAERAADKNAGSPLVADIDFPLFTAGDSRFQFQGIVFHGVHVVFHPVGDSARMALKWAEDGVVIEWSA
jgi:L-ascorbate metabolism protein UlaG (beta-lactamase superfamily)